MAVQQPLASSSNSKQTASTDHPPAGPKTAVQKLLALINASHLRFAWFLGNLTVVINSILYLLSFRSRGILSSVWYRLVFVGALDTFGIVLYQSQFASKRFNLHSVLSDDDTHYLFNALIWLIFPKRFLAVIPFLSFSTFHVLNFVGSDFLPTLGVASALASSLKNFTKKNHELSRRVAASAELLLLLVLVFRALLFKRWSWLNLIFYSVFIKVKSESSVFTRSILKSWEVRLDGLVSSSQVPPAVKSVWVSFKRGLKRVNQFSLIKKVEDAAHDKVSPTSSVPTDLKESAEASGAQTTSTTTKLK